MSSSANNHQDQRPPVVDVLARLEQCYGRPENEPDRPPLDELILTVLSQHTSDQNSLRAFESLKRRYSDWDEARAASTEEIATVITSGGLANRKAATIKQILSAIELDTTLEEIPTLPLAEAKARLIDLPGVGPKTAACVLLFGYGRPALPVDTHVHRVAGRLGLIPPGTSAEAAHDLLEREVQAGDVYSFHVNLIRHGRLVCRSRRPMCSACVVEDLCNYAKRREIRAPEQVANPRSHQALLAGNPTSIHGRPDVEN